MKAQLFRTYLGAAIRTARFGQGRTLRQVSGVARVSLGYLSEVERGGKEVSSETLTSICDALGIPLWQMLAMTSDLVAAAAIADEAESSAAGEILTQAA